MPTNNHPLGIEPKEELQSRLDALAGIPEKYWISAEDWNRLAREIQRLLNDIRPSEGVSTNNRIDVIERLLEELRTAPIDLVRGTSDATLVFDETLYFDRLNSILRSNISSFQEDFLITMSDQVVNLNFTPVFVEHVFLDGKRLKYSEYNVILPKSIQIKQPVSGDNSLVIIYQYLIN
jgi:hypothetical protein